jgi:hypothetical protein
MQQALLGRGSNRKTAAGGLKEVVLERCACAPQNMEEGGGSQDGNTVSRKGRGRFAPPQSASARGPLNGERAAREAEEVSAACSGDVQRRNKSYLHVGSHSFNEGLGAMRMVTEAAADLGVDGDGTEKSGRPDSGVSALSSGSYGRSQELEMAAGGHCGPAGGCQKRSLEPEEEEEVDRAGRSFLQQLKRGIGAGNYAAMRWTAEAQRSKVAVDMHVQRMTVASEAMSAMAAMLSTAGVVQNCEDRSRLFEADRAIAAMAAASRQEAAQAAQSSADASGKASELAETVSEALRVMAMDVESIASEIEDAVEIAVSRAKRQKAATAPSDAVAAREPSVGADEQEPDWLRSARAELAATATGRDVQDSIRPVSQSTETTVARLFAVCILQQAWRGWVKRRHRMIVHAADAAAAERRALAQRKRDARARLDAREAEEAARCRSSGGKRPSVVSKRAGKRQPQDAAIRIQAGWRGCRGRDVARQRQGLNVHVALCIQAMQTRLAGAQQRSAAATRIQAVLRGFCTRGGGEARWLARDPMSPATAPPTQGVTASLPTRSGGRQRRAARLAFQREEWQQQRAAYDWGTVQRARAEMAAVMGDGWEERAQTNLERSRLRYAEGLSQLAGALAPSRRRRLAYATWS